jgi:3-hydroxyisobutyrate dehydrogenase
MSEMKVGFIGLGIMGKPMALNLEKRGFHLVVYNRTRTKAEEIRSPNIEVADTPASVAHQTEVVITMVTDSATVAKVIEGENGVLDGIRSGGLVVDMSTIAPAVERRLAERLSNRGASLVDAPVSGGDVGAQNATLAIMAGGDRESFDRALPLFEAMGETITYCGPVGSGQLTKFCNQILACLNLLGVSEALAFARKNDLDCETMIEAVKGGAAGSWQLANLGPRIARDDYAPGFTVDLMLKDLRLVLEAAGQVSSALPGAALVHQLFSAAQARGCGREGMQSLAKVVAELSSV